MANQELVDELASVLDDHHPEWVFGCECTPIDEETGQKDVLDAGWAEHVAEIAVNFLKERMFGS